NRTYSEQLLSKRLEIYPSVNEIILRFMQDIRTEGITNAHVQAMHDALKDWEVKHSLLLSFKSRASYSELMKLMRTILHDGKTELKTLKALVDCVGKLRLSLKGDLGIFRIEFRNSEDGYFQTYDQLFAHHQKEEHEKHVTAGEATEEIEVKPPAADT
ncbi:MAG: hypothetical protein R3330_16865, partial [Saprospiraceae bacterium]|nr:hypothetical protein [Saprospiraceae bacterium]